MKMKFQTFHFKILPCLFILFLLSIKIKAQDVIMMKNGDEIQARVLEILPEMVQYQDWANEKSKIISIDRGDIFMIKYQNGTKDIFKESSPHKQVAKKGVNSKTSTKKSKDKVIVKQEPVISYAPKKEEPIIPIQKQESNQVQEAKEPVKTEIVPANSKNEIEVKVPVNSKMTVTPIEINENKVNPGNENKLKETTENSTQDAKTSEITITEHKDVYVGDKVDGKMNGYGKMIYANGNVYEGYWKNDKKEGKGKMVYKDGSSFVGDWKNDNKGFGTFTWPNGKTYTGYLN